jgi:hypothetical protein
MLALALLAPRGLNRRSNCTTRSHFQLDLDTFPLIHDSRLCSHKVKKPRTYLDCKLSLTLKMIYSVASYSSSTWQNLPRMIKAKGRRDFTKDMALLTSEACLDSSNTVIDTPLNIFQGSSCQEIFFHSDLVNVIRFRITALEIFTCKLRTL